MVLLQLISPWWDEVANQQPFFPHLLLPLHLTPMAFALVLTLVEDNLLGNGEIEHALRQVNLHNLLEHLGLTYGPPWRCPLWLVELAFWRFQAASPQVIPTSKKQHRNTFFRSFQPLESHMGHSNQVQNSQLNQGSTTWKKRKNGQAFCTWAVKVEGKHHMPNMPICHVNCVTRASWFVSFQDVFRSKRYLDSRKTY